MQTQTLSDAIAAIVVALNGSVGGDGDKIRTVCGTLLRTLRSQSSFDNNDIVVVQECVAIDITNWGASTASIASRVTAMPGFTHEIQAACALGSAVCFFVGYAYSTLDAMADWQVVTDTVTYSALRGNATGALICANYVDFSSSSYPSGTTLAGWFICIQVL